MKTWDHRFLMGFLGLGGAWGFAAVASSVSRSSIESPASLFMVLAGAGLYLLQVIAGVLLFRRWRHSMRLATLAVALQVPVVHSPMFTFEHWSWMAVDVLMNAERASVGTALGPGFALFVGSGGPTELGLNLLPALILGYLVWDQTETRGASHGETSAHDDCAARTPNASAVDLISPSNDDRCGTTQGTERVSGTVSAVTTARGCPRHA